MRIRNVVIVCLLLATTADADIIEHHLYTPTSLPSAQGWTYQSNGFDEEAVFEIVGDVLVMDTIGDGLDGERYVWYLRDVANAGVQSAVLRLRARVTDYEHNASEFYRGFFLGGHTPGWGPWFFYGLQDDAVYVNDSYLQDLDTSAWHEYTVITEGFYPDSQSTLLIDGEVAVVLTGDSPNMINDAFTFGDAGRNANARVEITEVEITTFDGAPVAIEQTSLSALKALFAE
jgi:hypothetical protein